MTPRRTLVASVGALLLVVAGCADDTDVKAGGDTSTTTTAGDGTVPARAVDISGTITTVSPFEPITEGCTPPEELDPDGVRSSDDPPVCTDEDNDILGTVLVEEQPGVQEGRKISFTVTADTVLEGPGLASFADLAEGQAVDAWASGPCAESYPEQCTAAAIQRTG